MKSINKIHSFFIALALIFWNPLCFYLVYNDTPVHDLKLVKYFFWIAPFAGFSIIYLMLFNKIKSKLGNILLSVAFTGIAFAFLVLVDGLMGFLVKEKLQDSKRLIFEPGSKAHYNTVEFDYIAEINSNGFRDREIAIDKGEKLRIMCFGDSWTFGWGVDNESTWPRKLEDYLKSKGIENVEVINCGHGGQYTTIYERYIKKIVPLFKPDLVLVGVLQLDDLAQLYETKSAASGSQENKKNGPLSIIEFKKSVRTFFFNSFSNTIRIVRNSNDKPVDVKSNWQASANSTIGKFSPLQMVSFSTLNDSVKTLFRNGDLNPGLLSYYIEFTDRNAVFNNPDHPATKFAISLMNTDLKAIKNTCFENGSSLIFVNLPVSTFTGHRVIRTPGDVLNSYFEKNNKIDSIYKSVAMTSEIPYFELTEEFRNLTDKSAYFFRYDGHPNEKGYEEMAKLIGRYLIAENRLHQSK